MRNLKILVVLLSSALIASVGNASPPITDHPVTLVKDKKVAEITTADFAVLVKDLYCVDFVQDAIKVEKQTAFVNLKVKLPVKPIVELQGYKYLRWCNPKD